MVPSARSGNTDIEQAHNSLIEPTTGQSIIMNNLINGFRIPTYEKGQDPKEWFDMYETGVKVAKIPEAEKLTMIPGSFSSSTARRWFFNQEFTDWATFQEEFMDRFSARKGSPKKILKKLLDIKRQPEESIRMYIDRFDALKAAHLGETKKNPNCTTLTSSDLKDAFINGLQPRFLKEAILQANPVTLKDAKSLAKAKEDNELSGEEESQSSDEEDFPTEKVTKSMGKKSDGRKTIEKDKTVSQASTKTKNDNSDLQDSMKQLAESFQSLILFVQTQMNNNNGQRTVKEKICYNCQNPGHDAKQCTSPCKVCQGQLGNHVYWDCPRYRPKNAQGTQQSF
ncbi:hypothetical protein G6F37_012180 [Rhizopus arrhizus]|nr:hypothetical protein G6F38_012224 [Rhizopus arrhizus]KAG1145218.1 hypothetical protein G6F37_012180 [Rhizopus arrhizus]